MFLEINSEYKKFTSKGISMVAQLEILPVNVNVYTLFGDFGAISTKVVFIYMTIGDYIISSWIIFTFLHTIKKDTTNKNTIALLYFCNIQILPTFASMEKNYKFLNSTQKKELLFFKHKTTKLFCILNLNTKKNFIFFLFFRLKENNYIAFYKK